MDYQELQQSWYFFLSLEKDLQETSRYIEPNGQEQAYSFEFYKIIMLACTEIETAFKQICNSIDEHNKCGHIGEYRSTILEKYPRIVETLIFVPRWNGKNLYPFKDWEKRSPEWWAAHQKIKHSRFSSLPKATYENAVTALAALFVLIMYLYKINGYDCKIDESSYFECEYGPQALYARQPKELPDFELDGEQGEKR